MTNRMNILFTTTKQWNVGDEIILKGIRNLLSTRIPRHTLLPWNRSPAIRPGNSFRDNSFDELRHSFAAVDYTVFAGSPEWSGPRVEPLFNLLVESGRRCSFLGLGSSSPTFNCNRALRRVLQEHTDVVTCRDQCTHDLLKDLVDPSRLFLLPCPSTFYSTRFLPRDQIKVLGLNYQATATKWHKISHSEHAQILKLFHGLAQRFEVRILCNYIDDIVAASEFFPREWLRYSPDQADFQEFYAEMDVVIGTRVHGCMGGLSNGLPAWLVNHSNDMRRKGVLQQIPALRELTDESPAQVEEIIQQTNLSEVQETIRTFKQATLERYSPALDLIHPTVSPEVLNGTKLLPDSSLGLRTQKALRLLQELPYHLSSKMKQE